MSEPRPSYRETVAANRRKALREKVVQWCRDVWRPYHGSTAHREDTDGNQMVEKKKGYASGEGHTPLNAAVRALWKNGKLRDSREAFMRELYRLACGPPEEVLYFSEIQDLFRDYGAGDSDYDELHKSSAGANPWQRACSLELHRRLLAVEAGIDLITDRLIAAGVTGREFWADFPSGRPSLRSKNTQEKKRERYLAYNRHRESLAAEVDDDGTPKHKAITNKALKAAAEECGVSKQTMITAVQEYESGYLEQDA